VSSNSGCTSLGLLTTGTTTQQTVPVMLRVVHVPSLLQPLQQQHRGACHVPPKEKKHPSSSRTTTAASSVQLPRYAEVVPQCADTQLGEVPFCPVCREVEPQNQYSCPGAQKPCQGNKSSAHSAHCKNHPFGRPLSSDGKAKSKSRINARHCPACYKRWLATTPGVCKRWGCGATDCPGKKDHTKLCRLGPCNPRSCESCRNAARRLDNGSRKRKRAEAKACPDQRDSPSPSSSSSSSFLSFRG
jgi:hypothetical protein